MSLDDDVNGNKHPWTSAEDEVLKKLIEEHGARHWSNLAQHIPGRLGKQCRERWFNHLCPDVRKGGWTPEEDALISKSVAELGKVRRSRPSPCDSSFPADMHPGVQAWSVIVQRFPGRTDHAIKNRA